MTQDRFFAKGAVYPFDAASAPFPLSHSPPSFTGNTSSKGKYTGGTIEENQVHSYNMRKNSHWRSSHEKESHVVRAPAFRIAFRMRRRAMLWRIRLSRSFRRESGHWNSALRAIRQILTSAKETPSPTRTASLRCLCRAAQ